jgi:hypothetical protein
MMRNGLFKAVMRAVMTYGYGFVMKEKLSSQNIALLYIYIMIELVVMPKLFSLLDVLKSDIS